MSVRMNESKIKKNNNIRKAVLFLITTSITVVMVMLFVACSGNVIVPGAAWSDNEKLTYTIKNSESGDEQIGTLTTEIIKLPAGDHSIEKIADRTFKILSNAIKGLRYKQTIYDNDGNIAMESESIFNEFKIIASYKKIYKNDAFKTTEDLETIVFVDDDKYKITINGNAQRDIKVKDDIVSNEILYVALRVYSEMDSGYTSSLEVINPVIGKTESLELVANSNRIDYTVSYKEQDKEIAEKAISCIETTISKSEAPIGDKIFVWYTVASFVINGDLRTSNTNRSIHIPVKIIENNLVYELKLAEVK
jgi:hypothetical protein